MQDHIRRKMQYDGVFESPTHIDNTRQESDDRIQQHTAIVVAGTFSFMDKPPAASRPNVE